MTTQPVDGVFEDRWFEGARELVGRCRIAIVGEATSAPPLVARLVADCGHQPTSMSTAREVLSQLDCHAQAFDLVLTSEQLPDMTGLELGRALRTRGFDVPVLLITGAGGVAAEGAVSGRFAVLRKPYSPDEFSRALAPLVRCDWHQREFII